MEVSLSRRLTPRHAIAILIEMFVSQQRYVPPSAYPLASPEDLPPSLEARVRSLGPLSSWRAWTDDARFWFIAARLCDPPRTAAGLLAMEVLFFDQDGRPVAAGEWTLRGDGCWGLRRVIDPSERAHAPSEAATRRSH